MSDTKFPEATPATIDKLKTTIQKYLIGVDSCANEGQVRDHVNNFIYSNDHLRDTDTYYFKTYCLTLLKAFTKRAVSEVLLKEMSEDSFNDIVEMITKLHNFTEHLDTDRMQAECLLHSLEDFSINEHNAISDIERYEDLTRQFDRKIHKKKLQPAA